MKYYELGKQEIDIAQIEDMEYKLDTVYVSENEKRKIWDAEFTCKKASTAKKRLVKAVPELAWIMDFEPEAGNTLSKEYDSYEIEEFDGTVYIAALMFS